MEPSCTLPAARVIIPVGAGQVLSGALLALDAALYASQVARVTLDVISAAPPTAASFRLSMRSRRSTVVSLCRGRRWQQRTVYGSQRGGPSGAGTVFQMDAAGVATSCGSTARWCLQESAV